MRIAVVYDCVFPWSTGGGERLYRALAERFAEQGHEVVYLTRRQWTSSPEIPGVRVVAVTGAFELYDDQGRRRLLPAIRFAAAVLRHLLMHRGRYDAVLVSALPVLNVLATRLALVGSRVRVCADWLEVWRPDQWRQYSGPVVGRVASLLQRLAILASPVASCHASVVADRLVQLGLRSPPVLSPGLLDGQVVERPDVAVLEPPTVVYVGRHIPDKRVETIPAALAHARRVLPELRAVLLGEGPSRPAVVAEVERLGLQEAVDLPGFVSQDALDAAIASARCLVNPSAREGYGLVVVEACAWGTPVVLVDAEDNAAVELVEPGVNGFISSSTSPQDLGECLVAAATASPALRASTRSWYERAARDRTVEATARGLLTVLTSARHPTAAPARRYPGLRTRPPSNGP